MYEPLNDTIEDISRDITKTITESSLENSKAIENLNERVLEIMIDRGIAASYLMCVLSKVTNFENTIQLSLVKDSNSNRVNDLLKHNSIQVTLYYNLLTFRDTG